MHQSWLAPRQTFFNSVVLGRTTCVYGHAQHVACTCLRVSTVGQTALLNFWPVQADLWRSSMCAAQPAATPATLWIPQGRLLQRVVSDVISFFHIKNTRGLTASGLTASALLLAMRQLASKTVQGPSGTEWVPSFTTLVRRSLKRPSKLVPTVPTLPVHCHAYAECCQSVQASSLCTCAVHDNVCVHCLQLCTVCNLTSCRLKTVFARRRTACIQWHQVQSAMWERGLDSGIGGGRAHPQAIRLWAASPSAALASCCHAAQALQRATRHGACRVCAWSVCIAACRYSSCMAMLLHSQCNNGSPINLNVPLWMHKLPYAGVHTLLGPFLRIGATYRERPRMVTGLRM